jgi:protocatechuate 3,4-dioxygenase beta subunit
MAREERFWSRRHILASGSIAASGLLLPSNELLAAPLAEATPGCGDEDEPTIPETEGPYFKPRSPLRSDLREKGMPGQKVELSGLVLTRLCRPIADAIVDLWHSDSNGEYDNVGFRLRGHVLTDAHGHYAFSTIMPGLYPGRTRHYHVKVKAPGKALLTTQFYFPNEARNKSDGLFRRELLMRIGTGGEALNASFDVVLA